MLYRLKVNFIVMHCVLDAAIVSRVFCIVLCCIVPLGLGGREVTRGAVFNLPEHSICHNKTRYAALSLCRICCI